MNHVTEKLRVAPSLCVGAGTIIEKQLHGLLLAFKHLRG
jgi:hypothetical protein